MCLLGKHLKEAQISMGKAFLQSALWLHREAGAREFSAPEDSMLSCWDGTMSPAPGEPTGPGTFIDETHPILLVVMATCILACILLDKGKILSS